MAAPHGSLVPADITHALIAMPMNQTDVEIESKQTVYQGRFRIDRYRLRHRLFAGGWSAPIERELFERGHAAALLPYDPVRDAVVLLEQFRIGAYAAGHDPWLIEIVAGIIEPDETAKDVVHRETREEAGLAVEDLVKIADYLPSPGGSSETTALYCGRVDARDAGGIHGVKSEGEDIRVSVLAADDIGAMLGAGRPFNATTLIALQWLLLNRSDLRRRWS